MERQGETTGASPTRDGKVEAARVREALRRIIDVADLSHRAIERSLAARGQGANMRFLMDDHLSAPELGEKDKAA